MRDIEARVEHYTARSGQVPFRPNVAGLCDLWVGAKLRAKSGAKVGVMWVDGTLIYPHVWAWERLHGPRPAGTMLSPICGWGLCIKPEHRELRPRGAHRRHSEPANAS